MRRLELSAVSERTGIEVDAASPLPYLCGGAKLGGRYLHMDSEGAWSGLSVILRSMLRDRGIVGTGDGFKSALRATLVCRQAYSVGGKLRMRLCYRSILSYTTEGDRCMIWDWGLGIESNQDEAFTRTPREAVKN